MEGEGKTVKGAERGMEGERERKKGRKGIWRRRERGILPHYEILDRPLVLSHG